MTKRLDAVLSQLKTQDPKLYQIAMRMLSLEPVVPDEASKVNQLMMAAGVGDDWRNQLAIVADVPAPVPFVRGTLAGDLKESTLNALEATAGLGEGLAGAAGAGAKDAVQGIVKVAVIIAAVAAVVGIGWVVLKLKRA